jgi:uncharacterized membrane protein
VRRVTGPMLWANLHLMFWLSLVPFTTHWMGANHFAPVPTALYGSVLLLAAVAYFVLQQVIIASQGPESFLKRAVRGDWKGKSSPFVYLAAIPISFWSPPFAQALYLLVALVWLVPDRRIERALASSEP